ncbi:hypothetical protein ACFOEE_14080 [Pseudoalteromonas fenneropenaei]|uniref:Anti-sigma factor n=1 Tax=Pseudoalteromonas fenneropenaei TaxID=1737459 RepID=A0ABV7CMA1_9GAMM
MSKESFDAFLQRELKQLPEALEPQRDLWTGIERAVNQEQQVAVKKTNHRPWLGVAACIGAAAVSWSLTLKTQPDNMLVISDVFETQKQGLLVQYAGQPALTDNWQVQLAELESAEQAIKQALKSDPQNAALLRMLSQVYQQQIDLINKVHQPQWQQI